jgi:hypothetical protein
MSTGGDKMRISKSFVLLAVLLSLMACMPNTYQYSQSRYTEPTKEHKYEILVKDIDGRPLEGAKIDYTLSKGVVGQDGTYRQGIYTTPQDGKMTESIYGLSKYDGSQVKYKISKDGYYSISGSSYITGVSVRNDTYETQAISLTLNKATDYFAPSFLTANENAATKDKILTFIDLILLQGIVSNANLSPRSINLGTFKDKKYLQFKLTSTTAYNTLRLNKYDAGKMLFDDVVRKILNPLNEYISGPDFWGYDITVIGYMKNFADKYADYTLGDAIEYRFMMPQTTVKKYKDKDISGQQLLDASIILINDERVDLKLQ